MVGGGSSAYRGSGGDVEPYTGKRLAQVVGESREELMSPVHLAGEIIQEGVVALPAMAMTTRSATLTATAHGKEGRLREGMRGRDGKSVSVGEMEEFRRQIVMRGR